MGGRYVCYEERGMSFKKKWLPPGNQSLLLTLNLNTMKN